MVEEFDAEGFSYWITHPDDNLGFYEQQLKKDCRKNNNTGDLIDRYNNYSAYKDSKLAHYVDRTVNLLPENGSEVRVKDLKQTLISSYHLDSDFADKVIREVGTNDSRISSRNHSYDKHLEEIRLRKKL